MTNMRASAARRRNKPLKSHNRSRLAALALAALLAAAYTAGVAAGKAAAHLDEDDELKIYMDHTHGEDEQ